MTPPPGLAPQTIFHYYSAFVIVCIILYFVMLRFSGKPKAKSVEDNLGMFNGKKELFGLNIPYDALFLSAVYIISLSFFATIPILTDWDYYLGKVGLGFIVPVLIGIFLSMAGLSAVIIALRTHLNGDKKTGIIAFAVTNVILFFGGLLLVFMIAMGDPWAIFGIGVAIGYLQVYFWGAMAVFALLCYVDKLIPSIRKLTASNGFYRGLYYLYHLFIVLFLIAAFTVTAQAAGVGLFDQLKDDKYADYWEEEIEMQRIQQIIDRGECEALSGQNHDLCLKQKSYGLGDTDDRLELCQSINDPDIRYECALRGAEDTKSAARAKAYCGMIGTESISRTCHSYYKELRENPCVVNSTDESCPLIACLDRSNYRTCFSEYGEEYGDPEGCNVLDDPEECYYEVALSTANFNACELISSDGVRIKCLTEILSSIKGASTCLGLRGTNYQTDCLQDVFKNELPELEENRRDEYITILVEG